MVYVTVTDHLQRHWRNKGMCFKEVIGPFQHESLYRSGMICPLAPSYSPVTLSALTVVSGFVTRSSIISLFGHCPSHLLSFQPQQAIYHLHHLPYTVCVHTLPPLPRLASSFLHYCKKGKEQREGRQLWLLAIEPLLLPYIVM